MSTVIPEAARVRGFVFETPRGERRLAANVDFDDRVIWGHRDDFDGRESVAVSIPSTTGRWEAHAATYRGTAQDRFDLHAASVDLGRGGVDVQALLRYGIAAMAKVNGPRRGAELVHLQRYGQNGAVYDVGKVDNHGIAWAGGVVANRISGMHMDRQPISDGDTVRYSMSNFGNPGNLRFEVDVFAPEITTRSGLGRNTSQAIRDMNLRVESPFVPGGSQPLQYINNVGPEGNDFRVCFQLADSSLFQGGTPPTGRYPVRILAGDSVVGTYTLDWRA